jgi:hypothetical protein
VNIAYSLSRSSKVPKTVFAKFGFPNRVAE